MLHVGVKYVPRPGQLQAEICLPFDLIFRHGINCIISIWWDSFLLYFSALKQHWDFLFNSGSFSLLPLTFTSCSSEAGKAHSFPFGEEVRRSISSLLGIKGKETDLEAPGCSSRIYNSIFFKKENTENLFLKRKTVNKLETEFWFNSYIG